MSTPKSKLTDLSTVASQLRKPHGRLGKEIGTIMNQGNRLMNLSAIDQLQVQAYDKILEIGMGNGHFVKDILSRDKTIYYWGCDFSRTMIEEAIALNKQYVENGQASFIKASATRMPFDDEAFNKVFTVNTIYFWENAETVLSEIRRVLQRNGLLILSLRPKAIMDQLPIVQFGFQTFSKTNCEQLLHDNGFKTIDIIEEEDRDIELSGIKYRNAFMIVAASKI